MALTLKLALVFGTVLVNLIHAEGKIIHIYVVVYKTQFTLPVMGQHINVIFLIPIVAESNITG